MELVDIGSSVKDYESQIKEFIGLSFTSGPNQLTKSHLVARVAIYAGVIPKIYESFNL